MRLFAVLSIGLALTIAGCKVDRSGLAMKIDEPADAAMTAHDDAEMPTGEDSAVETDANEPAEEVDAGGGEIETPDDAAVTPIDAGASDAAAVEEDAETGCGTYVLEPYPTAPCGLATAACARACGDDACVRLCFDVNDLVTSGECRRCYDRTQTRCANELGCQSAYDEVVCCVSEWCPAGSGEGCTTEALQGVCATPWNTFAGCYVEHETECRWRTSVCLATL